MYFLYDAKQFKDKNDIIALENKCANKDIYCIIETIDKKSSFYKYIKNNLIVNLDENVNNKINLINYDKTIKEILNLKSVKEFSNQELSKKKILKQFRELN